MTVPACPGCVADGETVDTAIAQAHGAFKGVGSGGPGQRRIFGPAQHAQDVDNPEQSPYGQSPIVLVKCSPHRTGIQMHLIQTPRTPTAGSLRTCAPALHCV